MNSLKRSILGIKNKEFYFVFLNWQGSINSISTNEMFFAICHHLYNLKNVKNSHGEVLLLVKLLAKTCNFTKNCTLPWMFSGFLNCNKSGNASQRNVYHITDFYEYFQKNFQNFLEKLWNLFSCLVQFTIFSSKPLLGSTK